MKIAIVGSAPSSVKMAPYSDSSWQIWGCSPGLYHQAPRINVWFELHRWEPPVLGRADAQKPWFTPEYCAWMAQQPKVWMYERVPEIPTSEAMPYQRLVEKYGSYFFTSSISWMLAMAIDAIQEARANGSTEPDAIGLWGVDMAANEEYADQRPGCQFFVQLAYQMGISVHIPSESDLMAPPMLYGIGESDHMMVKMTERRREIETRIAAAQNGMQQAAQQVHFLSGALDDINYVIKTWTNRDKPYAVDLKTILEIPKEHADPTG